MIGPHGHEVGFKRNCADCKAERAEIRAKRRKQARARKVKEQAAARRMTPEFRAHRAEQRRNQRATQYAKVVALPKSSTPVARDAVVPPVAGENEQAVREQCAKSSKAGDRPGTVAQAVTLARILDNPSMSALWPQTSRQLHVLLTSLDAPRPRSKGRLASVISMTEQNRKPKAHAAQ